LVTTKLSDPAAGDDDGEHGVDEGDNAKDTTQREAAEEVLLSQVTEEAVYGSGSGDEDVSASADIEGTPELLLAESDEDEDPEDDPEDQGSNSSAAASESFVVPKLHGKELKSVKWMQINELGLKNIAEVGREKLLSMKLPQARYRRKRREERERKALYDDLYMSEKGGHRQDNYRDAMQRLHSAAPMNKRRVNALERMKRLKAGI